MKHIAAETSVADADADLFLSAQVLRIQPWERESLINLLPCLEGPTPERIRGVRTAQPASWFDMREGCVTSECGTVACIGGWVAILGGYTIPERINHYVSHASVISALYYPLRNLPSGSLLRKRAWAATPAQAARAVRNFLTTGRPAWESVVG